MLRAVSNVRRSVGCSHGSRLEWLAKGIWIICRAGPRGRAARHSSEDSAIVAERQALRVSVPALLCESAESAHTTSRGKKMFYSHRGGCIAARGRAHAATRVPMREGLPVGRRQSHSHHRQYLSGSVRDAAPLWCLLHMMATAPPLIYLQPSERGRSRKIVVDAQRRARTTSKQARVDEMKRLPAPLRGRRGRVRSDVTARSRPNTAARCCRAVPAARSALKCASGIGRRQRGLKCLEEALGASGHLKRRFNKFSMP